MERSLLFVLVVCVFLGVSFAVYSQTNSADQAPQTSLQEADEFFRLRDYQKALRIYQEVAEKFSRTKWAPQALLRIGEIQLQDLEDLQATKTFHRLLKNYPQAQETYQALKILYRYYINHNEYEKGINTFQQIIDAYPHNLKAVSEAYFRIASLYTAQNQHQKALGFYIRSVLSYHNPTILREASMAIGRNSPLDETREVYAKILKDTQLVNKCMLLHQGYHDKFSAKPEQALEFFNKALEIPFDWAFSAVAYCELADLYLQENKLEFAFSNAHLALKEAKNNNQTFPAARLSVALVYEKRKEEEKALEELSKILEDKSTEDRTAESAGIRFVNLCKAQKATEKYHSILLNLVDNFPETSATSGAWRLLAEFYETKGEYEKAKQAYEIVLQYRPEDIKYGAWLYNKLGDLCRKENKLEEAEKYYREAIDKFAGLEKGECVRAYVRLWDLYEEKGEPEKANLMLQRALEDPKYNWVVLEFVESCENRRQYDKAIKMLTEITEKSPKDPFVPRALTRLGYLYETKGDCDKALEICQKVIKEYPQDRPQCASAQYRIALAYGHKGDYQKAQEELNKILINYPDQPKIIEAAEKTLITYLQRTGQFKKAIEETQKLLTKYRDNPELSARLQFQLVSLYEGQGEKEKALETLTYLLDHYLQPLGAERIEQILGPKYLARIQNKLADLYLSKGNHEEAERTYLKVIDKFSAEKEETARARLGLWEIYQTKGEPQKADEELSKALQDPKNANLVLEKAKKFEAQRDLGKAIEISDQAAQKIPKGEPQASLLVHLAYLYDTIGQQEKGIEICQQILKEYPENKSKCASAQYWTGLCYLHLGEYERAVEELKKVVANYQEEQTVAIAAEADIAYAFALEGEYEKAVEISYQLLEKYSAETLDQIIQAPPFCYRFGVYLYNSGKLSEAKKQFEEVLVRFSKGGLVERAKQFIYEIEMQLK